VKLSYFDIDFIKFKNEKDAFTLELKDTFFGLKEKSLYNSGNLLVTIDCEKKDSTINLNYHIAGYLNTKCERCLKAIKIDLDATNLEVLKLTGNEELLQEENYISANHQVYSTYDSIYELICLNMPTRKLCENSQAKNQCELNYQAPKEEKPIDDRWEVLKKLIK
jgi:uncharacterized protein